MKARLFNLVYGLTAAFYFLNNDVDVVYDWLILLLGVLTVVALFWKDVAIVKRTESGSQLLVTFAVLVFYQAFLVYKFFDEDRIGVVAIVGYLMIVLANLYLSYALLLRVRARYRSTKPAA